jgi:hypothetical protein
MNCLALPLLLAFTHLCHAKVESVVRGSTSRHAKKERYHSTVESIIKKHRTSIDKRIQFSMRRVKGDDVYGDPYESDQDLDWKGDDDDDDYDERKEEMGETTISKSQALKGKRLNSGDKSQFSKTSHSALDSRDKSKDKHH